MLNTRLQSLRAIRGDRLAGPFVTAIATLCLNALADVDVVAHPIYLACVVYAVFSGGVSSGLASTAIIVVDALIRAVAVPFGFTEPLREVKTIALACLILVVVTGHLKRRVDRAAELSQANRRLTRELGELARKDEAAMALAAMTRQTIEPVERERVHDQIVRTIFDLVRARHARLYWLDAASQELVCVAMAGALDIDWVGHRMPVDETVAGRAIRAEHLLCVHEIDVDGVPGQTVALPLCARGKVLGALTVGLEEGRGIMETDLPLLSIFAAHAALALENAQLYEELRATLDKLGDSQARLLDDARLQATEDVAAGVAHHVNNRLMVILTGIQLLMSKLTGEEHRRTLELVERATLNTAWLIERLRQFTLARSRATARSADLNLAARRAVEICAVDVAEAQARDARVEIVLALGPTPRVEADEAVLEEALAQIVRNAIEAVVGHGTITIATSDSAAGVQCSITDTGPGMPPDVAQRAPEPFFTTKGPQRLGLGLSAALGIVRQLGGQLEIDSHVGRGTRVAIVLRRYAA
ncbi:MAG TPA: ATP-binding protein [Methylomirabilota bacterium]